MITRRRFMQMLGAAGAALGLLFKSSASKLPTQNPQDIHARGGEVVLVDEPIYRVIIVDEGGILNIGPNVQRIWHLANAGGVYHRIGAVPHVRQFTVFATAKVGVLA